MTIHTERANVVQKVLTEMQTTRKYSVSVSYVDNFTNGNG